MVNIVIKNKILHHLQDFQDIEGPLCIKDLLQRKLLLSNILDHHLNELKPLFI